MQARRSRARTTATLASVLLLVAACTTPQLAAEPSATAPAASLAPTLSGPAAESAGPTAAPATPTQSAPPAETWGGAPLLVWQLDGTGGDTAKTETVSTLDLASGTRTVLGKLPVDGDTCCPTRIDVSADGARAALYSLSLRAIVDQRTGAVDARRKGPNAFSASLSNAGDRVAWLDDQIGDRMTVYVDDLDRHHLAQLKLPKGTWGWQERPKWSPDDRTLLVKAMLEVPTGATARLALYGCCTTHGTSAFHLYLVPVDGSQVRELASNEDAVRAGMADPAPTPPPGLGVTAGDVQADLFGARWSPDGRQVAWVDQICWTQRTGTSLRNAKTGCAARLLTADVETGAVRVLLDGTLKIAGVAWSPDSARLVFGGTQAGGQTGLYVVASDGTGLERLADTGLYDVGGVDDEAGDWSPDGSWIAFRRLDPDKPDGTDRVDAWVMRADGSDARMVAEHATAGW